MPKVNFVDVAGVKHELDVPLGHTLMEAAVDAGIEGIAAECGGACACATCHAYVGPQWLDRLPKMTDMEDAMLDAAWERQDNSRLSCQIEMTAELDGIELRSGENE